MMDWQNRLQPAPDKRFGPQNAAYTVNQQFLSVLIGAAACSLPLILWVIARYSVAICEYWSLSHFYYAPLIGNLFVGVLFIISALLIGYGGENRTESVAATLGGLFAFGVAALPTTTTGCSENTFTSRAYTDFVTKEPGTADPTGPFAGGGYFELFGGVETWHYISAAGLFGVMAFYTLVIFTRPAPSPDGSIAPRTINKTIRNGIYIACGIVILGCMGALLAYWLYEWHWWNAARWTFRLEALALFAFGIAWLVKGKPFGILGDERDRLLRQKQ